MRPLIERIMAKVATSSSGCHEYGGYIGQNGYGYVGKALVHRAVYEAHKGPIPAGLHIDHLCRNRICVNPAHLEAVTPAENTRRAMAFRPTLSRSGFRGVSYCRRDGVWVAQTKKDQKYVYLGRYSTAEEAARAYDAAARAMHGTAACLNFPRPGERAA